MATSIDYCRREKGMEVYAYCFMPSHVHFVFRSTNDDPSGLIRDFKGYTSRKIMQAIEENPDRSDMIARICNPCHTRIQIKNGHIISDRFLFKKVQFQKMKLS